MLFTDQVDHSGIRRLMESELPTPYYKMMEILFYIDQTEARHGQLALMSRHQNRLDAKNIAALFIEGMVAEDAQKQYLHPTQGMLKANALSYEIFPPLRLEPKSEEVPVKTDFAAQQFGWSGLPKAFGVDAKGTCNRSTAPLA